MVVTDLCLPGMNGRAVVQAIHQVDPNLGVILVTGSVSDEDAEPLSEPGVTLLRKPIHLVDFLAALRDGLVRRTEGAARIGSA